MNYKHFPSLAGLPVAGWLKIVSEGVKYSKKKNKTVKNHASG